MTTHVAAEQSYTRREFLIYEVMIENGEGDLPAAIKHAESWAEQHPDRPLDEQLTWAQWRAEQDPMEGQG